MRPELSIVLPAHNEANQIAASIHRVDSFVRQLPFSYEILVGDDGSTDGTAAVVEKLAYSRVRVVQRPWRGKGAILTSSFQAARGTQYVGFLDADLEIDIGYLSPMLDILEQGCDAAIASKNARPEYARNRPLIRRVATGGFNQLVRLLFGTGLRDHQAGLKLFRAACLRAVLPQITSTGWLWDTEVLVRLLKRGYTIREVPVSTTPRRESKTIMPATSAKMLVNLVRMYWRIRGPTPR